MRKTLVLSLFLLCATWAFAQANPSQSSPSSSTQAGQTSTSSQTTSSGTETKIEGCLSGSSGNYTLTDSSGKTWQLSGDTAKMGEHVGHKVRLTGTPSSTGSDSSDAGGSSAGASASAAPTFNVTSLKHISPTCTASQ